MYLTLAEEVMFFDLVMAFKDDIDFKMALNVLPVYILA